MKTGRKNARNWKKSAWEVVTFFWKISARSTNFEVSSPGLEVLTRSRSRLHYCYLVLPMQKHSWNWYVKYFNISFFVLRFDKIWLFTMVLGRLKSQLVYDGVARNFSYTQACKYSAVPLSHTSSGNIVRQHQCSKQPGQGDQISRFVLANIYEILPNYKKYIIIILPKFCKFFSLNYLL